MFGFEFALGKCFRNKENHIERCEKAIFSPAAQEQTKEEQKQASERDIMEKNAARQGGEFFLEGGRREGRGDGVS